MNADEIMAAAGLAGARMIKESDRFTPLHMNCKTYGAPYDLNIPYEQANPVIRDLCTDCIWNLQQDPKDSKNHDSQPEGNYHDCDFDD